MKHQLQAFIVGSLVCLNPLVAQTDSDSWGFNDIPEDSQVNQMSGPRFGFTYLTEGNGAQFVNRAHEMDSLQYNAEFGNGLPFTYTTQYGWQWETRFADTGGPSWAWWSGWRSLVGWRKGSSYRRSQALLGCAHKTGLNLQRAQTCPLQGWRLCLRSDTGNRCQTDDFRGLQFELKELSPRRGFFQT